MSWRGRPLSGSVWQMVRQAAQQTRAGCSTVPKSSVLEPMGFGEGVFLVVRVQKVTLTEQLWRSITRCVLPGSVFRPAGSLILEQPMAYLPPNIARVLLGHDPAACWIPGRVVPPLRT